ncbi:hypothetical protein [Methanobrevibacter arboriphilus]|uniref:Uncharacterized protein n=1 Tax=Methanobrevibacter arboriphilus TaxID=39441 RepID=A0ACA8R4T9_METAZ|nr:hypothetical protein [Methanobrevibacter arboriphilus]BBL62637.1 hypothetical protein MarbSA_16770 [Methanobrevibacter arboriphilus]
MFRNKKSNIKLNKIVSSKITDKQDKYLKKIKAKLNFKNNSESLRYLIEQHRLLNFDENLIVVTLTDEQYTDFQNIKMYNEFLTDTETINFLIKIQRAIFQELGSWNY